MLHFPDYFSQLRAESMRKKDVDSQAACEKLIMDLSSAGPLSACGFFNIERSTLTSAVGYSITYLIVLIQFKTAEI